MDSSDTKAFGESQESVIAELREENNRLQMENNRLKERLDNKARLMIYQEGYIDKQSHEIKTLKSDKYQKPKYQKKLKEADDRHKSRLKSLEASYLYREETLGKVGTVLMIHFGKTIGARLRDEPCSHGAWHPVRSVQANTIWTHVLRCVGPFHFNRF